MAANAGAAYHCTELLKMKQTAASLRHFALVLKSAIQPDALVSNLQLAMILGCGTIC
jgi:hypothetical protein